jgi:hypothetical protein
MANSFLTPSVIAKAALATLYETTVAAQLVHRDYSAEFSGKQGDTITVRKPAVFEGKEFVEGTPVEVQSATQASVAVVLNHHADVSFEVTSRDMSLKVVDFRRELLDPALEAIAQKIDTDILAFRNDITNAVGFGTGVEPGPYDLGTHPGRASGRPEALIDAATMLNLAKVPTGDRHAVIGSELEGEWLDSEMLKRVNESGSTEALREAYLGRRLFGFNPFATQNMTEAKGIAFHKTAVALVTRQLELPEGAANAAILDYKGFGIRVVIGYNQALKKNMVSLDTLYGVKTLDADRAVRIVGPLEDV